MSLITILGLISVLLIYWTGEYTVLVGCAITGIFTAIIGAFAGIFFAGLSTSLSSLFNKSFGHHISNALSLMAVHAVRFFFLPFITYLLFALIFS
ncbi:MAG: hypothetical protein II708_02270 [Paludibacteraceae bacterium]|nr:hypothetical protein [Paludibacteraceae bacterium]